MEHSMPFTSKNKDRMFGAQDWAQSKAIYFTTGVVQNAFDGLTLTPGTGLTTVLSTGAACVEGHDYWSDAPLTLDHSVTLSADRTDLVCLRMDALEARNIVAVVKEGTTTAAQTDDLYELPLYEVTVRAKADTIAAADIKDVRPMSALYPLPPYYPQGKMPELLWRYCLFPMSLTDEERVEVERSEQFMQIADKAATQYAKIGDSFLRRKFAPNMYDIKRATPLKEKGILPDVPEHVDRNAYPRYQQYTTKVKLCDEYYIYIVMQYYRESSSVTPINSLKATAILYNANLRKKCGELELPVASYSTSYFNVASRVVSFDKTTALLICPYQMTKNTSYTQVWAVEYGSFGLRKVAQYTGSSPTEFSGFNGVTQSLFDEPKLFFSKAGYNSDPAVCVYNKQTKVFTESNNRITNAGGNYSCPYSPNPVIRNGYLYFTCYEYYRVSSSSSSRYFLGRVSETASSTSIYTSVSNSSAAIYAMNYDQFIQMIDSDTLLISNLVSTGKNDSGQTLATIGAALWSISGNKKLTEIVLCDLNSSKFSTFEAIEDANSLYLSYWNYKEKCIKLNKQQKTLSLVDFNMGELYALFTKDGLPKINALSPNGSGRFQGLQIGSDSPSPISLENIVAVDRLKNPLSVHLNLKNAVQIDTTDALGVYSEMEISPYIEVAPAGISYYAYEVMDV